MTWRCAYSSCAVWLTTSLLRFVSSVFIGNIFQNCSLHPSRIYPRMQRCIHIWQSSGQCTKLTGWRGNIISIDTENYLARFHTIYDKHSTISIRSSLPPHSKVIHENTGVSTMLPNRRLKAAPAEAGVRCRCLLLPACSPTLPQVRKNKHPHWTGAREINHLCSQRVWNSYIISMEHTHTHVRNDKLVN